MVEGAGDDAHPLTHENEDFSRADDAAPTELARVEEMRNVALAVSVETVSDLLENVRSPATRRAYAFAWRSFDAFCGARGRAAYPATPATVAMYVAGMAAGGKRPSTIGRHLAAIRRPTPMPSRFGSRPDDPWAALAS